MFFDLETTGVSITQNRIVQIGTANLSLSTEKLEVFIYEDKVYFEGKLVKVDTGSIFFDFGKHVKDHELYAKWILKGGFSNETKLILNGLINKGGK